MDKVKILHCADIHLGSDFRTMGRKAISRRADLRNTFLDIVKLCLSEEIQILLIAGDLFESWTIPEDNFELARDSFANISNTKVVIAAGNHDPISYNSPYLRENFWPDNVFIMPADYSSIFFEDLNTEIWGASFSSSYVEETIFRHISSNNRDRIQIGIIHGTLGSEGQLSPYNPLSLKQISKSGLDYLALGHIHKASGVQKESETFYAYPGCPEARGFDELGEKGVLIGHVGKNTCNLDFVPTSRRIYSECKVDISGCNGSRDAANIIIKSLSQNMGTDYTQHLYKIFLIGKVDDFVHINLDTVKGYLDDIFYVKLRDKTKLNIDLEIVSNEMSLRGVFVRKMLERMEEDDSEALKNALKLGLKAFSGEVNYSED